MVPLHLKTLFLEQAMKHPESIVQGFLASAINTKDLDTVMQTAANNDAPDLLKVVMDHHQSTPEVYYRALYSTASDGYLKCVQLLWDKGVNFPHAGYKILTQAMLNNHVETAIYALEMGVKPNDKDELLLCLSAVMHQYELNQLLLKQCDSTVALKKLHAEHTNEYHKWQWFDEMIKSQEQKAALQNAIAVPQNTRRSSKM